LKMKFYVYKKGIRRFFYCLRKINTNLSYKINKN
jgi:hypothetical protein